MGRYHDGTVKDVLVHMVVNTHLHDQNAVHRPIGTSVRRNTVQQYWYRSLVHKARRRGWLNASLVWRVATGRSFCLPAMMGCHIRYQFVAYLFSWASSFPLSFLSCLVCTRYRSTIRAPSVIWGAVGGMCRMCVVSLVESVEFSYRSNENNFTHFHARTASK